MSAFLPSVGRGEGADPDHPRLQERPLTQAEQRARWEVRAAQWRARQIAELVFGRVTRSSLIGLRSEGTMRGLLNLEVPFIDLSTHRASEQRFMAAVETDPILSRVPLVYVLGAESG